MFFESNKFALLWGEAQKKIAYCYPKVTYSYPRVTYSNPKVTYSDPKVNHSYPTPPFTSTYLTWALPEHAISWVKLNFGWVVGGNQL